MRLLFICCISIFFLFAQQEVSVFDTPKSSTKKLGKEERKIYQSISASDENTDFEKNVEVPYISQSALVLNSQNYPQNVYVGELFSIELEVKTNEDTNFDFKIVLDKNDELSFLNPNLKWVQNNDIYKAQLFFEAKTSNAILNSIIVQLTRNNKVFQESKLEINSIRFDSTPTNKDFSHLVASSLDIKKVKTSQFDTENNIMMIELNAQNTNLKSFHIEGIKKQGVENLRGDFNNSTAYYYAILPNNKLNFDFSYFNKETAKLENFSFKLKLSDDELSTQSDLNPISKDFNEYKRYGLWIIGLLIILVFIFNHSYIALIIAFICFISGFLIDTSIENGVLKAGARVKILPTENSTYFYTAQNDEDIEILGHRQDYIKILLNDGKIGWANKNDLQKN
ncbi:MULTISPECIES: hypothetical protein [unclassified Campylobacter]|uniref:hypothetical protein n=1 Tax=unclassified Campylobacter TaxID=2593542 RepID=UPI001CC1DB8F|nr:MULTISPECIES: hypothetical protein [unclassified Campylobacter]